MWHATAAMQRQQRCMSGSVDVLLGVRWADQLLARKALLVGCFSVALRVAGREQVRVIPDAFRAFTTLFGARAPLATTVIATSVIIVLWLVGWMVLQIVAT